ncbi:Fe-S cluster assembly sulfur transfer protein SufU [Paraherbaspirillum soli]|uniref:Fe-S cluster assembly sulfur transfer protein SufU n=1 Tax=Paraherbaspirillum soli TaxID=631222 RepID=A0ABW0MF68_9BURK
MTDLRELYQEVIIDHYRKPRNFHALADANRKAEGFNPLCGDRLTLYVKLEDGVIRDLSFEGAGCAISTASASLMTEQLKGKTEQQAEALFQEFHHLLTQDAAAPGPDLGKLTVLAGVRAFPARVKCATLAWHTLHAALLNQTDPVSTE